ncbi:MAG TPA: zf-HC2 domain-containing protein [Candidatus Binataceae bacterium]
MNRHNQGDKRGDPFDTALRRRVIDASERAESIATTANCPPAELLAAYYDRSIGRAERDRLEAHFSTCARCQFALAAMARAQERAEDGAGTAPSSARWRPTWRVAIPAIAAVLAVVVVVGVMRRGGGGAPVEQVAAFSVGAQHYAPAESAAKPAPPANELALNESRAATETKSAAESKSAGTSGGGFAAKSEARYAAMSAAPRSMGAIGGMPNQRPAGMTAPQAAQSLPQASIAPATPMMGAEGGSAPAPPAYRRELASRAFSMAAPAGARPSGAPAAEGVGSGESAAGIASGAAQMAASPPPAPAAAPEAAPAPGAGSGFGAMTSRATTGASAGAAIAQTAESTGAGASSLIASDVHVPGYRGSIVVSSQQGLGFWRLGARGLIEQSDHGRTWHVQQSGVPADLLAGSSPSPAICWAVGRAGTIVRTVDGEHWAPAASSPTALDLIRVSADSADSASVYAADGSAFATADGGKTWTRK